MERQIKNAKIESTSLGYEDHGILTIFLGLDYSGAGQGFGGYALDQYDELEKKRIPTKLSGIWIQKILEVVGVDKWEDLKGKYIRVESDMGKVYKIGNLLEEKWFEPENL